MNNINGGFSALIDKTTELRLIRPVKTFSMLLIVLYHSCALWLPEGWFIVAPATESLGLCLLASWLNTIHVPTFILCSGYIYGYLKRETSKYTHSKGVIIGKIHRLIIPYCFVAVCWVIPFYCAFYPDAGFATVFWRYFIANSPSQLWFLPMLFWIFVIFEYMWSKMRSLTASTRGMIIASGFLFLSGKLFMAVTGSNLFQIASAAQYFFLFYAGYWLRQAYTSRFWSIPVAMIAVVEIILFGIWWRLNSTPGMLAAVLEFLFQPFVLLSGAVLLVRAVGKFGVSMENGFGGLLQDNSFGIYLFHQQIIWCVVLLLNEPSVPPILLVTVSFAVSLMVSLAISTLLGRFSLTRKLIGMK